MSEVLKMLTKLYESYSLPKSARDYRFKFSKAYKTLFSQQGGELSLCYLTEILDSAQENFGHLWVNGEKYVFSEDVIKAGEALFEVFNQLKESIAEFIDKTVFNLSPDFENKH